MMKKACLLLAPPLLAVLALALAAQFWLRPAVEEQARHRLTALTSVDGSPVQARVEAVGACWPVPPPCATPPCRKTA